MARAKIFKHGGSQAVRLPKEFRFEVAEVDVRKEGDAVILEPPKRRKRTPEEMKALWERIDAIRGDEQLERPKQPPFPPDPKLDW
jgi:antitoxin VapB